MALTFFNIILPAPRQEAPNFPHPWGKPHSQWMRRRWDPAWRLSSRRRDPGADERGLSDSSPTGLVGGLARKLDAELAENAIPTNTISDQRGVRILGSHNFEPSLGKRKPILPDCGSFHAVRKDLGEFDACSILLHICLPLTVYFTVAQWKQIAMTRPGQTPCQTSSLLDYWPAEVLFPGPDSKLIKRRTNLFPLNKSRTLDAP